MFSWSQIFGMIFSGTVVRLAGIAFAVYLGVTIGGAVIADLHAASAALALAH